MLARVRAEPAGGWTRCRHDQVSLATVSATVTHTSSGALSGGPPDCLLAFPIELDAHRLLRVRGLVDPVSMGSYDIRPVEASDIEQISAAHTAIWKMTYPGMVDQDRLDALTSAESALRWRETVGEFADHAVRGVRLRCATCTATQEMVGFATSGPGRDHDAPAPTELWSLNVVPRHHGSGVALDLMISVLGVIGVPAYLWVARDNARAVAFYRKHGFELDGATRRDPDWDCREERMTATRA